MSLAIRAMTKYLRYGAIAVVSFALLGVSRAIGLDAASAVGGFMGRHLLLRTRKSRVARENIALAFPEKSEAEREAILVGMWDNLGRVIWEYAHLDKLDVTGVDPRIRVADTSEAEKLAGGPLLMISGHFANWEVLPIAASRCGLDGSIVYRPPNNPFLDRYLSRLRARLCFPDQITKRNGSTQILAALRSRKSVLLMADQKLEEGISAPFFGRNAMTTPLPAILALKLGAPVMIASNKRLTGARFAVSMLPPLRFARTSDFDADVLAATAKINSTLESIVRASPEQWLWIHRRWPPTLAPAPAAS